MPKRRIFTGRKQREKDKLRKTQKRQQSAVEPPADPVLECANPCRVKDGAVLAPPSTDLGFGSMGLPPKEEKPLARVQASPCVKMHPPAPRLPSPRSGKPSVCP